MDYQTVTVTPAAGALGAEVLGIDLAEPLSDRAFGELHHAFTAHMVLMFRDQTLTPQQQIAFGARFGPTYRVPYVAHLADHPDMSPATRAFVLGYISHLVADEVWITTMFRPHFDNDNMVTDSEVEAHIWDRALQLDMDRQNMDKMTGELTGYHSAAEAMICADQGVEVEFLEAEVLQEWRDWVRRFIGWDFSWDRLKRALNRMYRDNDDVQQTVDRFLQGMPQSLERVYEKIPEEKLTAYRKQVLEETVAAAREYISGA